jgi:parallel beta-helix repeat protein
MNKKNQFSKGIAVIVIFLLVGINIPSVMGNNQFEDFQKLISYVNESKLPLNSLDTQMIYHECPSPSHIRGDENIIYSEQRQRILQQELDGCEAIEAPGKEIAPIDLSTKGNYTPHSQISIHGDDEFTAENGVVGGNGTSNNPYIIEGWEINAFTAIDIESTAAYFIIRNCSLKGGTVTVFFGGIERGAVEDIIISGGATIGFYISGSSNITIEGSIVSAEICIELRDSSHHVSLSNCTLSASSRAEGIYLQDSSFIVMSNLTIQNGAYGIEMFYSHDNTIKGCNIFSNRNGIKIIESPYTLLRSNTLYNNSYPLYIFSFYSLEDYFQDIDTTNTIDGKPVYYLRNASNLVFDGNDDIVFLNLVQCNNITVKNFNMSNSGNRLLLAGSRNCTVTNSTFTGYLDGIDCMFSFHTRISNCTFITIGWAGLFIINSPHSILRNNTISTPGTGMEKFAVNGEKTEDFLQDIDKSNTIDGKPIYYLVGEKNMRLTKNIPIGYLALVNCENMKVTNVDLSWLEQGLLLVNTTGIVRGCKFTYDIYGIQIIGAGRVTIIDCTVRYCDMEGFHFLDASNARVAGCTVTDSAAGFYLNNSFGNHISSCNIARSAFQGVRFEHSRGNLVCFNRMSGNHYGGVFCRSDSGENEICFNTIADCYFGVGIGGDQDYSWGNKIHHNTIRDNSWLGVDIYESNNNSITYNSITGSEDGLSVIRSNGTQIDHNNIAGNQVGLLVYNYTVDVRENWWGNKDGPGGIGPGSGDSIQAFNNATVLYEPWLISPVKVKLNGLLYILMNLFKIK